MIGHMGSFEYNSDKHPLHDRIEQLEKHNGILGREVKDLERERDQALVIAKASMERGMAFEHEVEHVKNAAGYWHGLYQSKCIESNDIRFKYGSEIEHLEKQRDELLNALEAIIPLAEFGASEQSPPYFDDRLIDSAKSATATVKQINQPQGVSK